MVMDDFLRSMRGEAGPRIARGTIKRVRLVVLCGVLGWLGLCAAIGYLLGPDVLKGQNWLMAVVFAPVLVAVWGRDGVETQIRHLNDLALAPFETRRMDMTAVKLMWLAAVLLIAALAGTILGVYELAVGGPSIPIFVLAAGLVAAGLYLSRSAGVIPFYTAGRYGPHYDPDEDEWTYGLGGTGWWR